MPRVLYYYPRYKPVRSHQQYSDFCRVKPLLNHPHRQSEQLLEVDDLQFDNYTSAYQYCLEHYDHQDDHYGTVDEPDMLPEEDEFERGEDAGDITLEDWQEVARLVPDLQLPEEPADLLGRRDIDADTLVATGTISLVPEVTGCNSVETLQQRQVYDTVMRHFRAKNENHQPPPLRLQIDGGGGTGKSGIHYLVIDEKSMLGLKTLAWIDQRLREVCKHEGVGAEKAESSNAGNLAKRLPLCVGCRVMLTRNLWADVGLVNGAQGTVYDISWKEGADVLRDPPEVIMVAFDDYDGPAFTMPNGEPLRSGEKLVVPILRVRQDFMVGANSCSREQFPLLVSYAITVHKSQGITLDKVVCDISAPEFASGLSYVAVSRVKTLGGLMFEKPFDHNRIYRETPSRAMGLKLSDHAIRQLQALDAVAGKDPSEESIGI
ncbi:hypothetical protein CHGG_10729 [Chaetomium globosum CBS 148.51]|uniref:DNA helicase Pif1-like 2B domain-containing protein n=1 Tax=Chaetomium globosum (strain ATCC 6205 / CBS 148.51 / DSM 1962 / NBRC 6347 / NRRL 1970) TaxID=306901 RepID=Q2GMS5_CHAGB|nr:uncharacterized protein CHGG_10729 [Chaetomium globosum CBS 148.51]EAQ82911.1 hypothetical protein CHGG_10729 [Chaetomium globosum CBS 148.51]